MRHSGRRHRHRRCHPCSSLTRCPRSLDWCGDLRLLLERRGPPRRGAASFVRAGCGRFDRASGGTCGGRSDRGVGGQWRLRGGRRSRLSRRRSRGNAEITLGDERRRSTQPRGRARSLGDGRAASALLAFAVCRQWLRRVCWRFAARVWRKRESIRPCHEQAIRAWS